nr:unnamed protein product [Spirometra erinaceieuropaei]
MIMSIRVYVLCTLKLQHVHVIVIFYQQFLPNFADLELELTVMHSGPKAPLGLSGSELMRTRMANEQ